MTHEHDDSNPADIQARLADAEASCSAQGIRLTPIRKQVLELLLRHRKGIKAYQLLDEVKALHEAAKPPTVYRALDFLLSAGLVHRLDSLNAYVACSAHQHRHHRNLLLVCGNCNAVSEVDDPAVCQWLAERVRDAGFELGVQCLEVKALCRACAAELGRSRETVRD